jgi:hypothetical protein
MAASRKQLFTSTNKDEYASSEESLDEDFDPSGLSCSPSDVPSTESDTVSLFRTIHTIN